MVFLWFTNTILTYIELQVEIQGNGVELDQVWQLLSVHKGGSPINHVAAAVGSGVLPPLRGEQMEIAEIVLLSFCSALSLRKGYKRSPYRNV